MSSDLPNARIAARGLVCGGRIVAIARTLHGKEFRFSEWNFDWEPELRRLADWLQDLKCSRPGWVNPVDESVWDRTDEWIAMDAFFYAFFFYIVVPDGFGEHFLGCLDLDTTMTTEAEVYDSLYEKLQLVLPLV